MSYNIGPWSEYYKHYTCVTQGSIMGESLVTVDFIIKLERFAK